MEEASRTDRSIRQMSSIEAAAIAGLAFSVLSVVSLVLLLRLPDPASTSGIEAYYTNPDERSLDSLSLNLAVFAAIMFLWFIAVIRRRMGDKQDRFVTTVFFGTGLIYPALMLTGSLILVGPSIGIIYGEGVIPGQDVYTSVYGMGFGLLLIVVVRVQAIFVLTTSVLALQTRILPRWLAILGFLVALVLLVIPIRDTPAILAFSVWVAIVSLALLVRRRKIETRLEPPSEE